LPQRILVADDDKSIVKVLSAYLEQSGYQVIPAYDGEMAPHSIRSSRSMKPKLQFICADPPPDPSGQ
jgi:DNA-binding response OmpR family regulator